jgi:4,5:9,10-diseco-3-hydroxy-5,9,17-trioxoandrosta-1(10),2-diene-4-oate hydrolase
VEAATIWREERVSVDGARLALRRAGRGRPVVCLHAIGHDGRDFEALAQRIGGRFEVIALDWPGHGSSGPDREPPSAARYGALLTGTLSTLAVDKPILIGNSIGGGAAILSASRRPVRGLVLCDSAGLVAVTPLVAAVCRVFARFFAAGERGARWYGPAYALYYSLLVLPEPAARNRRRQIIAQGRRLAPALRRAWESFARPEADIRDVAAELDIPVWAAWAENDRVIPLAFCRDAIGALRHGRLTRYRAGHAVFLEQPDAFAADFVTWADALPGGPSRNVDPIMG